MGAQEYVLNEEVETFVKLSVDAHDKLRTGKKIEEGTAGARDVCGIGIGKRRAFRTCGREDQQDRHRRFVSPARPGPASSAASAASKNIGFTMLYASGCPCNLE